MQPNPQPRRRRRLCSLLIAGALAPAAWTSGASAADEDPTVPAAATADEELAPPSWQRSPDPGARRWEITSYLNGTAAEVAAALNKQVLESDGNIVDAIAALAEHDRRAAAQTDALLAAARATPAYAAAAERAAEAKAALDAARAADAPTAERMAASGRYNKARAETARLERAALATPARGAVAPGAAGAGARVDTLYAVRDGAMAWRQALVDAILLGLTMRGPIEADRTTGIVRKATVEQVTADGAVLATFPLYEYESVVGTEEGITKLRASRRDVSLLIKGLDDARRYRPGDALDVNQAFRLTETVTAPGGGKFAYVVEPHPCDENDLLAAITRPPPMKAPVRATPATKPRGRAKDAETAQE